MVNFKDVSGTVIISQDGIHANCFYRFDNDIRRFSGSKFSGKKTMQENSERHGARGNSKIHFGQYSNDYKIFNST